MAKDKGELKLKKNALFNSLSFVFISGVSFLTLPLIIGKMNAEVFGIYILLTGLFGYFGIFDFGLGQGLVKFVSEYQANHQLRKMSLAINSCLLFQLAVGTVLFGALYFLSGEIIRLLNVSPENVASSEKALKIALCGLLISFVSATFSSVLMGLQRYDLTSVVDSLSTFLINITLVGMLVYSPVSLPLAVFLSVFFSFLSMVSYLVLIRKNVPHYQMRLEFDVAIVKQFIRYSINIFLSKLSALFSTYLVRFILAYFLTPAAVTLYVVPNKLLGAVGGVLSSGANSLFPFVSTLYARNDKHGIRQSFLKATGVFTGIAVPAFLFLGLFSKPVLTVWMGEDFAGKTWLLLSITSISSLLASASTVPNLVILGMGNSRLVAFFSVISIVLYLIFLPWLTVQFGLIGSAAALLLNSVISIAIVFRYCLRYLQISFLFYIQKTYSLHLLPSVVLCGAAYCFQNLLTLPAISVLAIGGGFLSLYYAFVYVVLLKNKGQTKEESNFLAVTDAVPDTVAS